jgi:STE24 endopeptidase
MSEMTATRIGRLATLVVFAGAWLVAAALLWRTSVPTDLRLHGTDVLRYFSSSELAQAARYERFLYAVWALHLVATIAALVLLTIRAPRLVRMIPLGRIATGVILGAVMLVTLWLVSLPFGFAEQWWAVRYGLAPKDYLAWFLAPWAELTFQALSALVLIAIVMALAGKLGDRWWVVGAPLFTAFSLAFGFLGGYVAGVGTQRMESPALRASVRTLEQREHVTGTPVTVQLVGDITKEVDAFSYGFGPSAHVVLWDTLLDGRLRTGEVRFVVAHELGHVAHRHVLKAVGWSALLSLPLAWLLTYATRPRGGLANPEALPLALLALVVVGLLAAPLENAVSRRYEAEADWSALRATKDTASGRELFVDFERTSLTQPSPPLWAYLWLEDHPTLAQRIAMVEQFATRSRPTGLQAGS